MNAKPKKHVSIAFIALALSIAQALCAASQANIQWLQHMSRQLEDRKNRAQSGVMRHIVSGIKKKLAQSPELATLPFTRVNAQNARATDLFMPTTEATLLLRAMETANFPAIKAMMEAGANPLQRFDFAHQNGQDRAKGTHLGALFEFATNNQLPPDQYVETFIQCVEYASDEKSTCLDDYYQCRGAFRDLPHIPEDHKQLILESIAGSKSRIKVIEQLLSALEANTNRNARTALDSLVEKSVSHNAPSTVYLAAHEPSRHRLQTYLLEKGIRLNKQPSLHNTRAKKLFKKRMFVTATSFAIGTGLAIMRKYYPVHSENLNLFRMVEGAFTVYRILCKLLRRPRITTNHDLDYLLKVGPLLVAQCQFFSLRQNPENLGLLIKRNVLTELSIDLFFCARRFFDETHTFWRNLAMERYQAWKKGITDIWGRKIPESLVDEVGGLE